MVGLSLIAHKYCQEGSHTSLFVLRSLTLLFALHEIVLGVPFLIVETRR